MQSSEVQRRDTRLLALAAVVAITTIAFAAAWALTSNTTVTSTPSASLPSAASPSAVGMGNLREVDVIDSAALGVGNLRAIEFVGSPMVGMGNLRVLEATAAVTVPTGQLVGMGDVLADRLSGSPNAPVSYAGMGDLHSRE